MGAPDGTTVPAPGALDGVKVLDLSRVLAGPYATMLLADLGADVTKFERPGVGDDTRAFGPPWHDGEATYYLGLNRNKRADLLDLTDPADVERIFALMDEADVLVENFMTGSLDRFGLGYDQVRERAPHLVYCSITGFGSAEGRTLPGYDLIAQATSGLMSITGDPASGPTKVGVALADAITGLHATIGILAALRHRDLTGEGQHVEVNLLSSALASLTNQISGHLLTGNVPSGMGNAHPSIVPYEPIPTADRMLAVAAATDRQFASLVRTVGRPELADDPRFSSNAQRVVHRDELIAILGEAFSHRTADAWFEALSSVGVPCGPINDLAQAVALAERLGLEPVVHPSADDERQIAQIRNPIRLSRTPATYRTSPPRLPVRQPSTPEENA